MTAIRVLPETLVARIAAGEVVERPASIVKELVENGLDAGGRRIAVEIEAGGKKRIRVDDDGHGMQPAEARLAFRRHATSKIGSPADLDRIESFGFRGEALPSIAAVARVRMRTATGAAPSGTRLVVDAGGVGAAEAAPGERGTSVEVTGLFDRIPARRKFLRSIPTETAHVTDLMNRFALAHPDIDFRLRVDGRQVLAAPPAADRAERIRQLFGREFAEALVPVGGEEAGCRVAGFVSRSDVHYSTRSRQYLFVNRRPIHDRSLSHAIHSVFQRVVPPRRFPAALLFLEVPPDRVDVNIHPAKNEVRFHDPGGAHDLVARAVRSALDTGRPFAPLVTGTSSADAPTVAGVPAAPAAPAAMTGRVAEATDAFLRRLDAGLLASPGRAGRVDPAVPRQTEMAGPPVRALAQYRDSFIIGCDAEGLLVVDQHAAHERILYERHVAGVGESEPERQRLLFPRTLELSATQMVAFEAGRDSLEALGYRIEPFGGRGVLVREVPAVVDLESLQALLADLLTEVGRDPGRLAPGTLREKLAVTTACHAAVKIHQPLGRERMDFLLRELFQTSSPTTCPHGRPAVLRITHPELLGRFRRR